MNKKYFYVHFTIAAFLLICIFSAYLQVKDFEFVNYDDPQYILQNKNIQEGVNTKSILWSMQSTYAFNWHPLTWLSHTIDYSLFGLNAGGHHFMSLFLHCFNSLLLYSLLHRATRSVWRSAFVAALFALHPLHVESVAWVSERKDVLSALFWMAAMNVYVSYTKNRSPLSYLFVCFLFFLGIMSKPMVVTLPIALLLFDYWPLNRMDSAKKFSSFLPLVKEKIPLFLIAAISSGVTIYAQKKEGAMASLDYIPLELRLPNVIVSYLRYVGKMVWPVDLAVFYPFEEWSFLTIMSAFLFLPIVTVYVFRYSRRYSYLVTGWLWYLCTLLPVIGIVQVGAQSMADRYSYISLTGLFIIVAWGGYDIASKLKLNKAIIFPFATAILLMLTILTYWQTTYWRNSFTLFEHTLKSTKDNYLANFNLAVAFVDKGHYEKALERFQESVRIRPDSVDSLVSIGTVLKKLNRLEQALSFYQKAFKLESESKKVHFGLGLIFMEQRRFTEAVYHFKEVLRLEPNYVKASTNLGFIMAELGNLDESAQYYKRLIDSNPSYVKAYYNLGVVLVKQGKLEEGLSEFEKARTIQRDYKESYIGSGAVLVALGRINEAVQIYKLGLKVFPGDPGLQSALNNTIQSQ